MNSLLPQDIYDIAEHIVHNMAKYIENYNLHANAMSFKYYILTNVAVELKEKYTKMQITEAFEDSRIDTIISFYEIDGDDEDEEFKILH